MKNYQSLTTGETRDDMRLAELKAQQPADRQHARAVRRRDAEDPAYRRRRHPRRGVVVSRPGYAACARVAAEYYGRLALVAIAFHIKNGNPAELDAARVYARYAAAYAAEVIA